MADRAEHTLPADRARIVINDADTVPRHTLVDGVYDRVRAAIFNGQLPAGAELNQVDMARQYGVSRVPVREALRRLQAEHLLVANPFQRFVVSVLRPEQVLELHDIRAELEIFALKQTMKQPADILQARIVAALDVDSRMRADTKLEDWMLADRAFHRALNGETTAVAEMIEDLRDRVHRYSHIADFSEERRSQVLRQHQAIIEAMRAGNDAKATKALRAHVDLTRDMLEQSLRG